MLMDPEFAENVLFSLEFLCWIYVYHGCVCLFVFVF